MKTILILIILLAFGIDHISAQYVQKGISDDEIRARLESLKENFVENTDGWVFTKVVEMPDNVKDDIYLSVIEVLANLYNDSNEVIQSRDKEAGIVIAKGFIDSEWRKLNFATNERTRCWQVVKFEIRDNRFRITLTVNEVWSQLTGNPWTEESLKFHYPYNQRWPAKGRWWSFNNLIFAHDCSMQMLGSLASGVNARLSNNNDW